MVLIETNTANWNDYTGLTTNYNAHEFVFDKSGNQNVWWMSCPHCSKMIEVTDQYCKHCGQLLKEETLKEKLDRFISKLEQELKKGIDVSGYCFSKEQKYTLEEQLWILKDLRGDWKRK